MLNYTYKICTGGLLYAIEILEKQDKSQIQKMKDNGDFVKIKESMDKTKPSDRKLLKRLKALSSEQPKPLLLSQSLRTKDAEASHADASQRVVTEKESHHKLRDFS